MCTSLKTTTSIITPGVIAQYKVLSGLKSGKFGIDSFNGTILNAREERLGEWWKTYERGILEAEAFYEKGAAFGIPGKLMKIGCLYAPTGSFVIVTTEANALVAKWHHRMPLILTMEDEGAWYAKKGYIHADYLIQLKAA